jgi:hypothetical protein
MTMYTPVSDCSGQSNMVFPLKYAYNPAEEMATLQDYPNFRFFTTARDYANTSQFDLSPTPMGCDAEPCNQWLTVEQATAPQPGGPNNTFLSNFSAVCFLTVRDIARMHTNKRPVALIQSAWGGTRVEAWMSPESIATATPLAGAAPPLKPAQNNASVLWNAMVAPWSKYAVRAALWYQVSPRTRATLSTCMQMRTAAHGTACSQCPRFPCAASTLSALPVPPTPPLVSRARQTPIRRSPGMTRRSTMPRTTRP